MYSTNAIHNKLLSRIIIIGCRKSGVTKTMLASQARKYRYLIVTPVIYPAIINGEEQTNLHIIFGHRGDVMIKLDMFSLTRCGKRLKLHQDKVKDQYDHILIDTNPLC